MWEEGRTRLLLDKLILQCLWGSWEVFGLQLKMWVCARETLQGWSHEHRGDNTL